MEAKYKLNDHVIMKKPHACGTNEWIITRVGVDFKLQCLGCGHIVTMERQKALKAITKKEEKS